MSITLKPLTVAPLAGVIVISTSTARRISLAVNDDGANSTADIFSMVFVPVFLSKAVPEAFRT